MNPRLRNRLMKKLTLERGVPMISASVSLVIFGMTVWGTLSFPKFASKRNGVCRVPSHKNAVVDTIFSTRSSTVGLGQKDHRIERPFELSFRFHTLPRQGWSLLPKSADPDPNSMYFSALPLDEIKRIRRKWGRFWGTLFVTTPTTPLTSR